MKTLTSIIPATGEILWEGPISDKVAVEAAIASARAAFPAWSHLSFAERQGIAERFRNFMESRKNDLVELISRETGKVRWDAEGEVSAFLNKIPLSIKAYHERTGEKTADPNAFVRQSLSHHPHGVMAVFGPYNFPAHLPNGHIVPALLAGNTIVFKPSEETPAVGEFMAGAWQEAGLPDGVLNLVQGARETGEALVASPDIDGVLFTGSYPTGKAIHKALAGRPEVILALEMGGNNPLIVWEAGEPEKVARLILQSSYITTGQRCTCARRLILPQGAEGDKVIEALLELIKRVRVGAYSDDPQPFMGPLINNRQAENILAAQTKLESLGGKILQKSLRLQENLAFLTPSLIDVTGINLPDEEYFGPLAQVIRVDSFEEALQAANNTKYGLAAGLVSDNVARWQQFCQVIRAGIVNWNRPTTGASSAAPFGGVGHSGNHRPSAWYAADYCAWPMASMAENTLTMNEPIQGLHDG